MHRSISNPKHLYVHVPFCAHRCGYCDFVTTSAQPEIHERYVAALAREFDLRWPTISAEFEDSEADNGAPGVRRGETADAPAFDTIFIGGGTPTLLTPNARTMLLDWVGTLAADGAEITIECNPETVDGALADALAGARNGPLRVSLGAQSFSPHVLDVLERRGDPDTVRRAVTTLRSAGIERLSLDVIWGVPGQSEVDVRRDIAELAALEPEHVSAYELELKPGTRLAHRYGTVEAAIGEDADELYDVVVDGLEAAGYSWYETANFAREEAARCRHNLGYWMGRDYMGIGVGAVGTIRGERRMNLPNVPRWLAAVEAGELPPARLEEIPVETARLERVMLGLRLAGPFHVPDSDLRDGIVSRVGLRRVVELECGRVEPDPVRGGCIVELNRRGRMLLNSVMGLVLGADGGE